MRLFYIHIATAYSAFQLSYIFYKENQRINKPKVQSIHEWFL